MHSCAGPRNPSEAVCLTQVQVAAVGITCWLKRMTFVALSSTAKMQIAYTNFESCQATPAPRQWAVHTGAAVE